MKTMMNRKYGRSHASPTSPEPVLAARYAHTRVESLREAVKNYSKVKMTGWYEFPMVKCSV